MLCINRALAAKNLATQRRRPYGRPLSTLPVLLNVVETQREDLKDDFVQNFHPIFFFAFSFHIQS